MERDRALQQITKELATAKDALRRGNEGMARVCARRAAGAAISAWLETNPRRGWEPDAMSLLRGVSLDDSIPFAVREAAERLSAKVTTQAGQSPGMDPIRDCWTIVGHLIGAAPPG